VECDVELVPSLILEPGTKPIQANLIPPMQ
jgi:hypothetical protein